jgi:monoamine oxidase
VNVVNGELDVIVIGCGFSGLAAARRAVEEGARVLALEARNRVGGRVMSRSVGGTVVELGAQWVGPGQTQVKELARTLGVATQDRPSGGADLHYDLAAGSADPTNISDQPPFDRSALGLVVSMLDELAETIDVHAPAGFDEARRLDTMTVASYCDAHLPAKAQPLVHAVCEGFIGVPEQVSMLHALFYAKANGGFLSLMGLGTEPHDSEVFPEGASLLAERMAESLSPRVLMGRPVTRVAQTAAGVEVGVADGTTWSAGAVVVALPPAVAEHIRFEPDLSAGRTILQRRYLTSSDLKFQVVYDAPFWRDAGYSGSVIGPGFIVFDGSTAKTRGVLTGFFSAAESLRVAKQPCAARKALVCQRMAQFFGPRALEPIAYDDHYWLLEPYSRGCVAAPPPGVWSQVGAYLRGNEGRIFWAGAETSVHMPGQIEGALLAGQAAAREAMSRIG